MLGITVLLTLYNIVFVPSFVINLNIIKVEIYIMVFGTVLFWHLDRSKWINCFLSVCCRIHWIACPYANDVKNLLWCTECHYLKELRSLLVFIDLAKVQDDEVGDGTTSVTVFAAELLRVKNIFCHFVCVAHQDWYGDVVSGLDVREP